MDVSFEQGRAHHVPSKFITDSIAIGWGDIPHFKKSIAIVAFNVFAVQAKEID
jgi:hypothetical protein